MRSDFGSIRAGSPGRTARFARTAGALTILAAAALAAGTARADAVADFYKGKTMTILVGAEEGGPYANYTRVLLDHFRKQLPGNPTIIVQMMAGAGGVKMANYMANVAPKDGSVLGIPLPAVPLSQALGQTGVKYDAAKFFWIGNLSGSPPVLAITGKNLPAKTLEEAKTTELIFASSGKGSVTFHMPAMINSLVGTKFKIVTGYKGGPAMDLAIERGEVHGRAYFYENLALLLADKLKTGETIALAQIAIKSPPELAKVPNLATQAATPEARAAFEFYALQTATGRAYFTPQDVPADRVAALRKAFLDATASPAFAADMQKHKFPFDVTSGEEVQAAVVKLINTPKPVIDNVRQILGLN